MTTTCRRREQSVLRRQPRTPALQRVTTTDYTVTASVNARIPAVHGPPAAPSLYVLNAAALSKPRAVDHLAADLKCCGASVAVITETHFKHNHTDGVIGIDGYSVFRRDRIGRKGGGVALYVQTTNHCSVWSPSVASNHSYELLWVRIGMNFVSALYHPPRPSYSSTELLDYIENCVAEISHDFPLADIVLAGDLNQLSDDDVVERTGLTQIVHQPTRGASVLDRIFVSDPHMYSTVRVISSIVRSDHKAVVAMSDGEVKLHCKNRQRRTFRPKTPSQNARFLQHLAETGFTSHTSTETQAAYDSFYAVALNLLNSFYPERTNTVSSRDPSYMTPEIKAKLRRKNRLARSGRVEEASALAKRIGHDIDRRCKRQLRKINGRTDAKDLWAAVRSLTGRQQEAAVDPSITAKSLNRHYAAISTDGSYEEPLLQQTVSVNPDQQQRITEYAVFRILDKLHPTATGLASIPSWFLRLAAPVISRPVADLFNLALTTSTSQVSGSKLASCSGLSLSTNPYPWEKYFA